MSDQNLLMKVLLVLGMLVAPACCERAIAMSDFEGLCISSEIHLARKDFQRCGLGMHRICSLGSCFYIVKFPSMWNRVEFIQESAFKKGMDLDVIEVSLLRPDNEALSLPYIANFLNLGKGVAIFRLPIDEASSVLRVSYGVPHTMELDVKIPIPTFNRSYCIVNQAFLVLTLRSIQFDSSGWGFLPIKLIHDCLVAFCDEEDLT
jgi:hypothetical protein